MNTEAKPILIIGGGISGMTAALEAAEIGYPVVLVEKEAYLGGRVMRTYRYFPKMCPPTCGFEINVRRLRRNSRVTVYTMATIEAIASEKAGFTATIKKRPRYVKGLQPIEKLDLERLTSERINDFNLGMDKTKALYWPHDMAYPYLPVLDRDVASEDDVTMLQEIGTNGAIDLEEKEAEFQVEVGAIIVATGWRPYDANRLPHLKFGVYPNVITNVMMERFAARGGPTEGKIVRPSDGQPAESVAFVQCAGSRDENHLPYCSAVCCMASLKQARYVREKNENSKATIFYIDIRTTGRLEKFYYEILEDENASFIKGKVAEIHEDPESGDLILDVEDTISGQKPDTRFDLVVLATGVVPNTADLKIPIDLKYDQYGFVEGDTGREGVYVAGCAKRPCDVSRVTKDSTAAALKAIQYVTRGE